MYFCILQRFVRTLYDGVRPEFERDYSIRSNAIDDEKNEKRVEVKIENESSKGGLNKSASAIPFLNAEERNNSSDNDLSGGNETSRII